MDLEQKQESSTIRNPLNEYVKTAVELDPNFSIDEYPLASIWDAEEATNTSTTIPNYPTICEAGEAPFQWQVSATAPQQFFQKTDEEVHTVIHPRFQRTNYSVTTQQSSFDGMTFNEFHGLASREGNQSHDNVQSLHQLILTDFQLPPEQSAGHGTQTVMVEQPKAVGGSALVSPVTQNGFWVSENHIGSCGGRGLDEDVMKSNGRKRGATDEGKVWRRKIKHREAAERSRARKADYVAQLEEEVNQLMKENALLQVKYELQMKQMTMDTMDQRAREKTINGHKRLRRCFSCPT